MHTFIQRQQGAHAFTLVEGFYQAKKRERISFKQKKSYDEKSWLSEVNRMEVVAIEHFVEKGKKKVFVLSYVCVRELILVK